MYECGLCFLRFSDPMRSGEPSWYAESSYYRMRRAWLSATDPRNWVQGPLQWNFRRALSVMGENLDGSKPKLLDVGCGEGQFLSLARSAGFDVTGLDFNHHSLDAARRVFGLTSLHCCSLQEFASRRRNETYDVITLLEVLEHMADPLATLRTAESLLTPNGKVIISVPSYRRWPPLFDPVTDTPPHHLTLWTDRALASLIRRAHLEPRVLESKRLDPGDLGCYLKLKLKGFFGSVSEPQASTSEEGAAGLSERLHYRSLWGFVRAAGWFCLTPACWVLKLNSSAGGFTLFAEARRPD